MLKVMTNYALVFLTNHLFALTLNLLTRLCFTNIDFNCILSFFTMPICQIKELYQIKLQRRDEDRHVTSET